MKSQRSRDHLSYLEAADLNNYLSLIKVYWRHYTCRLATKPQARSPRVSAQTRQEISANPPEIPGQHHSQMLASRPLNAPKITKQDATDTSCARVYRNADISK